MTRCSRIIVGGKIGEFNFKGYFLSLGGSKKPCLFKAAENLFRLAKLSLRSAGIKLNYFLAASVADIFNRDSQFSLIRINLR